MTSRIVICSLCIATLVSCAPESEGQSGLKPVVADSAPNAPDRSRFEAARINKAKRDLSKEPRIGDLIHSSSANQVDWQVGTFGLSLPAFHYADYICAELAKRALVDRETDVRIFDLNDPKAQAGDLRSSSLGRVDCATGAQHRF